MSRSILVTGAAGFAGSHLLDRLAQCAERVVAWQRPDGSIPRALPNVEWQSIDLLDSTAVRRAIADIQPRVVYHCAGWAHVGRAWTSTEPAFAVNVRGTHYLVEALRAMATETRILIPSSAQVYASADAPLREDDPLRPSSPYGLSKLAQELVASNGDGRPPCVVARAFNHFGPRQSPSFAAADFARRIAEIEARRCPAEISVGNLDTSRDLTDVRDTVHAYHLMAERAPAGAVYNVCSGRAVKIGYVLELLLARARLPIQVKVDPSRYRPNDQPCVLGSYDRIRAEIGWSPTIPLEQTIDDLLTFWRSQTPAA